MRSGRMVWSLVMVALAVLCSAGVAAGQALAPTRDGGVGVPTVLSGPVSGLQAPRTSYAPRNQRGVPLFTREWTYDVTGADSSVAHAEFDLEGNLITVSLTQTATAVRKFTVSDNTTATPIWTVDVPIAPIDSGVDLDGNVYIAGYQDDGLGGAAPAMAKVSSQGFVAWTRRYDFYADSLDLFFNLALDADGVPFASAYVISASVDEDGGLFRIDPLTGAVAWFSVLPGGFVQVDRRGNVLLYPFASNPSLWKVDGGTGAVLGSRHLFGVQVTLSNEVLSEPIAVGLDGTVVVAGEIASLGYVVALDEDLVARWLSPGLSVQGKSTHFVNVKIDREGDVCVGGAVFTPPNADSTTDGPLIGKLNGVTGGWEWAGWFFDGNAQTASASRRDTLTDLAFDRLNNPYFVNVEYRDTPNGLGASARTYRLSRDGDAQEFAVVEWSDLQVGDPLAGTNNRPLAMAVDPGGNVVTVAALGTDAARITKISQPYEAVPTIQGACASLSFENQSIWAPGVGNLEASTSLFEPSPSNAVNPWNIDEGGEDSVDVPILGTFGGGFVFRTSGNFTVGAKAEINGGSADVHFPFDMKFVIPSPDVLFANQPVTIETQWTADPAARLTSCFTPTMNAGLTAGVDYSIFSRASLTAFSASLFNTTFVNASDSVPVDYVPNLNLLDILSALGSPIVPGEWASIDLPPGGLFTAQFRTPQMMAQGRYSDGKFTSLATDRFFIFSVSITEAILRIFGLTANLSFEVPATAGNTGDNGEEDDGDDFKISGSAAALQLIAKISMGARQEIEVETTPTVRYTFSDGIPTQTLPLGQPLNFTLPSDGHVDIIPTLATTATFRNRTDIEFIPGVEWKTLEFAIGLAAFGFDLFSLGECIACFDWDLAEILDALGVPNPTAVNMSFNLFPDLLGMDSWQISFPEQTLACMRVLGSTMTQPRLVAASRGTLPMIIYDQTLPTVSSFNIAVDGGTRMLLFGERLFNAGLQVSIEHYGRVETLARTHINDSTLLVEIPNRFRLLPGVAKIWVQTSSGTSETIDLPITYPVPRLDAVNPNLWAADPDLAVLPISVIDAKTFVGTDTFIARRDYYIKMRNDLWTAQTAGGIDAQDYFPGFDFNQMPEFPAVLWGGASGGVPLPRFVQPVDNGIHNVRLAERNYDRPQLVPVVICNPGPGGGASNELTLTIAAPVPVATSVVPNQLQPTDLTYAIPTFTTNVVGSTGMSFPESEVVAADVDGDGDTDLLTASGGNDTVAWWENTGGAPPVFTQRVISTTADGANDVFAADVDGDGDIDVLSASASDDKVAWHENSGDALPAFTEHIISVTADNALSVFAADVDGDGHLDVLSASSNDDTIAWYRNDGATPPAFTGHIISVTADGAISVFAADVDGDGDTDVLSASRFDDTIAWYENSGDALPAFTEHIISVTADNALSVFAADVDGDGHLDALSASSNDDKIAWYRNDGATPPAFTEHIISVTANGAYSLFAVDVDDDGDVDVLSTSFFDDKVAWHENIGGTTPSFLERVISTASDQPVSVFAADLDGDADIDVVTTAIDNTLAWYANTPEPLPVPLMVHGPYHVPTFNGYEEPKYGNFNADSVVRFNGIDLETTFVGSHLLLADLPPELVTLGDHSITVRTPDNGTAYFEERWRDVNGDGIRDDEDPGTPGNQPYFQGLIASGGESAPLLFRIRYREPKIDSLLPQAAEQNSVAFDDSQFSEARPSNMTVMGEDFRQGAVVYFNGEPRETTYKGPRLLGVKLLQEDVALVGTFPIAVHNPGPDFQISEPATFKVTVPAPQPLFCRGDLDQNRCTDLQDFLVLATKFGTAVDRGYAPDYDDDGWVTTTDFAIWVTDYGCGVNP